MACILISVDAGASTETHHSIHELVTTLGSWWAHVASTWLVDTDATVMQVRDAIDEVVEGGSPVLVIGVTPHWATIGIDEDGQDWLDVHT